uniref:Uncharacterized protein n=1 Tax=uncultured organism MedDCM-OCT-S11-C359 TaxID=743661 RepID=D6PLI0_9ZZZZ|nr:hypothetical protein [uncultured organism MedDCM-OCT-S11-C359]
MKLVRIPADQLDTVWSLIEKDIKDALAFSGNLTSSSFVLENSKKISFKFGFFGIKIRRRQEKNILV